VFLSIFYVLQCVSLSLSMFFSFLAILQVLEYFSFFTFNSSFWHISRPTVCVCHFPSFWVFLATLQVLQCIFLIFHDF
jgi:hypothetical protein